jgi:putative Holliday junction resolvase
MKDMLAVIAETKGPLLGLDLGVKTIGVALSDPDRSLATPVTTIKRSKFTQDAQNLLDFARERRVVGFILGLPRNMDGTDGPKVQSVKTFAKNIGRMTDLPIGFWDERLSTAAAERELLALDVSRKKRAAVIDAHAAGFILQGALDRLRQMGDRGQA